MPLQLWAVDVSGHARALPDAAAVARARLPASEAEVVARFVRAIDRARECRLRPVRCMC
jgi:hypothetical protein